MQMQSGIFNELVMEEAIKDKTAMVQKEMENAEKANLAQPESYAEEEEEAKDSDSDFNDDDDSVIRNMRELRMAAAKAKQSQHQIDMANGHGQLKEITEEEFLPTVTGTRFIILAFYHKDFERCKIVDMHLSKIAREHTETKFCKIDAEKCPFFVAKLAVQMLPTIVCFCDGISVDRVVGFEEIGGSDDFPTMLMTRRLIESGCLMAKNKKERGEININKRARRRGDSSS